MNAFLQFNGINIVYPGGCWRVLLTRAVMLLSFTASGLPSEKGNTLRPDLPDGQAYTCGALLGGNVRLPHVSPHGNLQVAGKGCSVLIPGHKLSPRTWNVIFLVGRLQGRRWSHYK